MDDETRNYWPSEVGDVTRALWGLIEAMKRENEPFAEAVARRGVRFVYDSAEKALTVNVISEQGRGMCVGVIDADERSPNFGMMGAPMPIAGIYGPASQKH